MTSPTFLQGVQWATLDDFDSRKVSDRIVLRLNNRSEMQYEFFIYAWISRLDQKSPNVR